MLVAHPSDLPFPGKLGDDLRSVLRKADHSTLSPQAQRAQKQIGIARIMHAKIVSLWSASYPHRLRHSKTAAPLLVGTGFVQAAGSEAMTRSTAVVGVLINTLPPPTQHR